MSRRPRAPPEIGDMVPEHVQCSPVGRHGVAVEVAAYDPPSHFPCSGSAYWPAPGSEDAELGVLMEPEVGHGEAEVYTRVQA